MNYVLGETSFTVAARDEKGANGNAKPGNLIAFNSKDHGSDAGGLSPTLRACPHNKSHANSGAPPAIAHGYAVRRLMPIECEKLQGFPPNWTAITYRGKSACDGPRYRALGNSMAVPVLKWLGQRIAKVQAL